MSALSKTASRCSISCKQVRPPLSTRDSGGFCRKRAYLVAAVDFGQKIAYNNGYYNGKGSRYLLWLQKRQKDTETKVFPC